MTTPKEVIDFLTEIDDNFHRSKVNRVSRMDITWGKWSRDLNLRMRERQDQTEDPTKSLLVWLFMYWMNRSQLLELNFKHRLTHNAAKRELIEQGANMKQVIVSGDPMGPPGTKDQIKNLLAEVGKEFNKRDDTVN
jgi:hypothetical protein